MKEKEIERVESVERCNTGGMSKVGWRKRIRLYRLAMHRPKGPTTGSVMQEEGRTHFSLGRQTGLVTISQSRSRLPFGTFIFFFFSHFSSFQKRPIGPIIQWECTLRVLSSPCAQLWNC